MSEQDIDKLESLVPARAESVLRAARQEALDAGLSVVEVKEGVVYETFPDGTQKVLKQIKPPQSGIPGTVYTIK
jgi:hypothetical protein